MSDSDAQKFALMVRGVRALQNVQWDKGHPTGVFFLDDANYALFLELDQSGILDDVDANGVYLPEKIKSGCNASISLVVDKRRGSYFAEDMDDFLKSHDHIFAPPGEFYIGCVDYWLKDDNTPAEIQTYFHVVDLASALEKACDHSIREPHSMNLIFLDSEKLELPIKYDKSLLIDELPFNVFQDFLKDDAHKEERKRILKSVFLERLRSIPTQERFPYLLRHLDEIVQAMQDRFHVAVSGFSFEKIRNELEERKLKFLSEYNKVISEIHNKILVVPVSLVLSGLKMERKPEAILQNVLILTSVFIFSFLMTILLFNQRHTLEAIRSEARLQESRLKENFSAFFDKLREHYEELEKRYQRQNSLLTWFIFSVWFVFFVSLGIFLYYTDLKVIYELSYRLLFKVQIILASKICV
ncbi:MAG: hypothetical protein HQL63_08420 [Magnetococcales bacterium]|nr:hypothetical protein [Magnetococcales bacterium]MBF0322745.1 hypothetical protein [Magnetococcales bacterium]